MEFTAGLGYGRFTATRSIPIPDITLDEQQANKCVLTDINGDGLADLVLERAAPGSSGTGSTWATDTFSRRKIIIGLPTAIGDLP